MAWAWFWMQGNGVQRVEGKVHVVSSTRQDSVWAGAARTLCGFDDNSGINTGTSREETDIVTIR